MSTQRKEEWQQRSVGSTGYYVVIGDLWRGPVPYHFCSLSAASSLRFTIYDYLKAGSLGCRQKEVPERAYKYQLWRRSSVTSGDYTDAAARHTSDAAHVSRLVQLPPSSIDHHLVRRPPPARPTTPQERVVMPSKRIPDDGRSIDSLPIGLLTAFHGSIYQSTFITANSDLFANDGWIDAVGDAHEARSTGEGISWKTTTQ
ncbi:hypothetical protein B0H13DRAFT_2354267 [Mycena leptocephala]|nr:hypothetical protein B0H13DRAFT_2354267 [Mycena leptocephala]